MYADDTKIDRAVNNEQDQKELQLVIDKLTKWSSDHRLILNFTKTIHLPFYKSKLGFQSHYYMDIRPIKTLDEYKDFGVTFDKHLTFKPHIENLITKKNVMYSDSLSRISFL